MQDYKKIEIWQEAVCLVTDIYAHTKGFPMEEKFGLVSQMNRSAISMPSNIAEGAGRVSKKEFLQFLSYSMASSYEVETQIIIACNLKYISEEERNQLTERLNTFQKKTRRFMESISSKIF